jgi:hypothetical protein
VDDTGAGEMSYQLDQLLDKAIPQALALAGRALDEWRLTNMIKFIDATPNLAWDLRGPVIEEVVAKLTMPNAGDLR